MGNDSTKDGSGHSRGWPLARTRWAIIGAAVGVFGSSWVGVGHHPQRSVAEAVEESGDVAQPAVEAGPVAEVEPVDGAIDGAVRKVSRGIRDASTTVRDRYEKVRGASRNVAQASEVSARLRQDKGFDSDRIDVQVDEEGTVILKGQVADVEAKELAVESTRDIRGVMRVEDHLAVPPKPRVFSAPPGLAVAPRVRRTR
jgi:hypothetical protein